MTNLQNWGVLLLVGILACANEDPTTPVDETDTDHSVDEDDPGQSDGDDGHSDDDVSDGSGDGGGDGEPSRPDAPEVLNPKRWSMHWTEDIQPYWMVEAAWGEPEGNFPSFRDRQGLATSETTRFTRMLSRQVYTYSMGYLLTGQAELLEKAQSGVNWLFEYAIDEEQGGCHPELSIDGVAQGGVRFAQDLEYCALGLAAWYFVTRDPRAEAAVLEIRDVLFDPNYYWDEDNQRIRDELSEDMTPTDNEDNAWELVAQLDALNGFILLMQPVLSEDARRDQFLADASVLVDTLIDVFWEEGIFWGISNQREYGGRHVDYGHTLKSYWMVLLTDKRLEDRPYQAWLNEHVDEWLARAFDGERWKQAPTSATQDRRGSDWWVYAEAQQLAATVNMENLEWSDRLGRASTHWLDDYVDRDSGKEVISGIGADGRPAFNWSDTDTFKCNLWKNGFHTTEHALVMYLHGSAVTQQAVPLYFAVSESLAQDFVAVPYVFQGRERSRKLGEPLSIGDEALIPVVVEFENIH